MILPCFFFFVIKTEFTSCRWSIVLYMHCYCIATVDLGQVMVVVRNGQKMRHNDVVVPCGVLIRSNMSDILLVNVG